MKKSLFILLSLTLSCMACSDGSKKKNIEDVIDSAISTSARQMSLMAGKLINQPDKLPRSADTDGLLTTSSSSWWTSGFFPGTLWYLYEITGDTLLRTQAELYTNRIEKEKFNKGNHDAGFMLYCSFGNGFRLTGNEHYKSVLLQGAESLSSRYKESTRLIRSWDFNKKEWQYPVIIDNMMNLELLQWAAKNSDNVRYDTISRSHADITIKNHFRKDNSTFHVVSYDTISGAPEKKQTHQGYSDNSTWARGQAWALYGYTMMYRETKESRYKIQAEKIARFILGHPNLPEDKIPYWDFDAPEIPDALRDASAGAIMASAFIELSELTGNPAYMDMAKRQIRTLSSPAYLAEPGTNAYFILKHSVGNMPKNSEVDVPLTYADYYYVEALVRYKKIVENGINE